jgi:hypothetical protein
MEWGSWHEMNGDQGLNYSLKKDVPGVVLKCIIAILLRAFYAEHISVSASFKHSQLANKTGFPLKARQMGYQWVTFDSLTWFSWQGNLPHLGLAVTSVGI